MWSVPKRRLKIVACNPDFFSLSICSWRVEYSREICELVAGKKMTKRSIPYEARVTSCLILFFYFKLFFFVFSNNLMCYVKNKF